MKHPKLSKPVYDTFARVDIGVFGAPCEKIQAWCADLAAEIKGKRLVYVDADHRSFRNSDHTNLRSQAFDAEWIDHGMGFDYKFRKNDAYTKDAPKSLQWLNSDSDADLALVNANHFEVANTILFWHPEKEASVRKRDRHCANCKLVLADNPDSIPEAVRLMLPKDVAYISCSNKSRIDLLVNELCPEPPLSGIVLAGGESRRMGTDKTQLELHGKKQYIHQIERLQEVVPEPVLSIRAKADQFNYDRVLTDRFEGLGPFGAILSAFMSDPGAAWLVVAADLPQITDETLKVLLKERDPSKAATAFMNPETGFPDPLCTIYEPKAYSRMLHFLSRGVSCPRKVLINSDVKLIHPDSDDWLLNLNTPEDLARFRNKQSSRTT